MTTRQLLSIAFVAGLHLAPPAVRAQDDLGPVYADFFSQISRQNGALIQEMIAKHPFLAPPRFTAPPEPCLNLPSVEIRDGAVYKNGKNLGRGASYKTSCNGAVAWQDDGGNLHLDEREISSRVEQYDISERGNAVAWRDSYGTIYRNGAALGRGETYVFVPRTGDVVWLDAQGFLHRNDQALGSGRPKDWKVAGLTGDVLWTDNYRALYRNDEKLALGVDGFEVDADGKATWTDSYGKTYSR